MLVEFDQDPPCQENFICHTGGVSFFICNIILSNQTDKLFVFYYFPPSYQTMTSLSLSLCKPWQFVHRQLLSVHQPFLSLFNRENVHLVQF